MNPDKAIEVARQVLEVNCKPRSQQSTVTQAALSAIDGAIKQKTLLASIAAKLSVIDKNLAEGRRNQATKEAEDLRNNWIHDDCKSNNDECRLRPETLKQFVESELGKRNFPQVASDFPWLRARLVKTKKIALAAYPVLTTAIKEAGWLVLAVLVSVALYRILGAKQPDALVWEWKVWTIRDDAKSGAAGAIMEALDVDVNPLVSPFIRDGNAGDVARSRRQILLAPPILEANGKPSAVSTLAWKDFLVAYDAVPSQDLTFIERLPFKSVAELPIFTTNESYDQESTEVTVGSFKLAGILPLIQLIWQRYNRKYPSVVGVVDRTGADGKDRWAVRLTCRNPRSNEDIASVWAESTPTEYGDPLGMVAQRAAFKLILRIMSPPMNQNRLNEPVYTSDQISAIAAYRQGVQLLMRLI
jgi:hypothetical protein